MAERRMFAKTIVLSDVFLDMPMSARCLYFTLGMLADDDGFVNAPRSIMRQCGASEDDMRVLISKKFVLEFESGVIVIKHWRINNYLRNDRYTCTKYTDEKKALCIDEKGSYSLSKTELAETVLSDSVGNREWRDIREEAYEKSSLPYCFGYKIRQSFSGEKCPVCGCTMINSDKSPTMPTIQHNIPISKGGEHELYNISVICRSCNARLKDAETGNLNNADVIKKWNEISGIPNSGIPSIGKVRLDKDSIGEVSKGEVICAVASPAPAEPPIIVMPCLKGEEYAVSKEDYEKDMESYPAVDVMQEYKKMKRWLESNQKNKKTKNGMPRFINNWLSKEQNRGGTRNNNASKPSNSPYKPDGTYDYEGGESDNWGSV